MVRKVTSLCGGGVHVACVRWNMVLVASPFTIVMANGSAVLKASRKLFINKNNPDVSVNVRVSDHCVHINAPINAKPSPPPPTQGRVGICHWGVAKDAPKLLDNPPQTPPTISPVCTPGEEHLITLLKIMRNSLYNVGENSYRKEERTRTYTIIGDGRE